MSVSLFQHRRAFAWQALCVLLPLLILVAVGAVSLRQDRALARFAAVERAQAIAHSLAPLVWAEIQGAASQAEVAFTVGPDERLERPPPLAEPADLLDPTDSPASAEAARLYAEGLQLARNGQPAAAAGIFVRIATEFRDARGETGLPLKPLAELKYLEAGASSGPLPPEAAINITSFCSNVVTFPGPMTPLLLERVERLASAPVDRGEVGRWIALWERDQSARQLFGWAVERFARFDASMQLIGLEHLPWPVGQQGAGAGTEAVYLVRTDTDGTHQTYAAVEANQLGPRLRSLLQDARLPHYLSARLELAGDTAAWVDLQPAPRRTDSGHEILASAAWGGTQTPGPAAAPASSRAPPLKVDILLSDPRGLYSEQRQRSFWFGLVIAVSAAAALIGLAGAWRSFRREEQLSALKTNFVSGVSHELRAPIASVRLMAENLERGTIRDEPRRLEYFRLITQECRRLSSLVENVLDFSRIEQGRKQYEFEPSDVAAMVRSTARLMEPLAAERRVALRIVEPPAGPVHRSVDGKALQQALVNLLDNALKHSPPEAAVEIGLHAGAEHGPVTIWVEDQGPGIPEAEHDRIFARFYRLGSELRRETQGVGIGLSIVKHIVEAHGGQVRVRSAPGAGSRFTIELPGLPTPETHVMPGNYTGKGVWKES